MAAANGRADGYALDNLRELRTACVSVVLITGLCYGIERLARGRRRDVLAA